MNKIIKDTRGSTFSKNRKLIASLKATSKLIKSTQLKWLLEKGAVVTKLYGVIPAERAKPFEKFVNWVSDKRRDGDRDADHAIIAEAAKLVGNSAYGRTGMNKNKFKNTRLCDEKQFNRAKNNYFFYDADEYKGVYEVTTRKRTVKQDMPIQVAFGVLDDAKLRMIEFHYDCIDKYIDRRDFQYMYMDTDSAYMSLSNDFEALIKPEMKADFEKHKNQWFPRTDTFDHEAYDKRTPGLFKLEYTGNGMIALSSKTYYCWGDSSYKFSSKGVQKARNKEILNKEAYSRCLVNNEMISGQNKGFRFADKNIKTYEQSKIALTPIYVKGVVMDDGLHIRPLNI
jgi:DNA polymerase type B, organellar and viral